MYFMWFILGGLTVGALWGLGYSNSKKKFTKLQLSGFGLSIMIAIFAVAWSISSIAENESQAAAMGIMIFGGIAVILFIICFKLEQLKGLVAKRNSAQIPDNKEAHL